uniref:uncharacterized protein LOC122601240 n=1 Tax=Erigeron canadensis TaxID=72917 RepID=UPI001CB931D2|nr:uncharacterized protein LOC122601240 [Erigeron canadensis]
MTHHSQTRSKPYSRIVPYLQKLRKSRVKQRGEIFKDTLYGTKVTIPFTELVRLTPGYARYIMDMIKEDRIPKDVHGIEKVKGILEKGDEFSTPKLEDPSSFVIPCKIGNKISCDCLADIGASINLMPWSMNTKLSNVALDTTMMTIKLADQTFQRRLGKTQVVIVTVGDLHFHAKFVVMNIPGDKKVPIILGRPFLNTTKAVIEVAERSITIGNDRRKLSLTMEGDPDLGKDDIGICAEEVELVDAENRTNQEIEEVLGIGSPDHPWDLGELEEDGFDGTLVQTPNNLITSLEEPPTDLEMKSLP